jgi:hypothetical protein
MMTCFLVFFFLVFAPKHVCWVCCCLFHHRTCCVWAGRYWLGGFSWRSRWEY